MIIAGVDPGKEGAIALLDTRLGTLRIIDMPKKIVKTSKGKKERIDGDMLGFLMHGERIDVACIEHVSARRGQGVSSMFSFGEAFGIAQQQFAAHLVPSTLIRPQEWQRLCRVAGGEHVKDNARDRAVMLYPAYAGYFGRKMDSGRADATLIAHARAIQLGEIDG